ncbi:anti-sigma factor family protein [Altererythrobacter sp.]|uniref:anti-sigma factor family protein n=1 Tax=Altererythrobacter sp. TaxID=1872480 RepID=UPI003D0F679A
MSISPEELAAFADGELSGEAEARVAEAIAADPELARQVEAHRALKAKLASHFAPVLEQDVPDRLTQLLSNADERDGDGGVVGLAKARDKRQAKRVLPAWGWAGGAIAASLVAALVFTVGDRDRPSYAGANIASALETQLVATQPTDAGTRILLSFRNGSNELCRAFTSSDGSGIACRDDRGWRYQAVGSGSSSGGSEYRMAGSDGELMAIAQDMADGPALTSEDEVAARDKGWRD